jgi:pectin methylesterase-like acyl-CoA thioesterase
LGAFSLMDINSFGYGSLFFNCHFTTPSIQSLVIGAAFWQSKSHGYQVLKDSSICVHIIVLINNRIINDNQMRKP